MLIDRDSTQPIPLAGETLAVTRYGERMAVGAGNGIIRIWNLDEARIEKTLRLDDRAAETFRAAAAGSWARRANPNQIWDLLHWLVWLRADVALLPEGALTRFGGAGREKTADDGMGTPPVVSKAAAAAPVGEPVPGPATEALGKWARGAGTFLAAPLVEVDRKTGKRYSAVVVFDPHGRQVLHARKRRPFAPDEAAWASEGDLGTPVADTPFGRIGVLAGGDLEAEARAMADMKVDLALHPMHAPATRDAAYLGILKDLARRHHFAIIAACPLLPVSTDICPAGAIIGRDGKLLPWPSGPRTADDSIFGDLPLPLSDATPATDRPRDKVMNKRIKDSWKDAKSNVFLHGERIPTATKSKRATFDVESSQGAFTTIPVTAFVSAGGRKWVGPEQSYYIETDAGIIGFRMHEGGILFWCGSLTKGPGGKVEKQSEKDDPSLKFEETVSGLDLFDAWIGIDPDARRQRITNLRQGISPWFLTVAPFSSQPGMPKIVSAEINDGQLKLNLTDQMQQYNASV